MKKNMLTIIVIALSLINVVLTALMVFVVVPTSKHADNLMTKVASVIDLELESPDGSEAQVDVKDSEAYKIESAMTINLKKGADGKEHFGVLDSITLYEDTKHEDFSKLSETIPTNESFIMETVNDVISQYTNENASENRGAMKEEILKRVQDRFNSDFIYDLSFGNLVFQ